jgi:starvation-inducible DNA-binding protein
MTNSKTAQHLNILLADYAIFTQKARNYHWNVRGPHFFDLHAHFEALYTDAAVVVDDLAERVSRLAGRPASTYAEFIELAHLKEDKKEPNADGMVKALLADMNHLQQHTLATLEVAEAEHDVATVTLLEDLAQRQEKSAWMLSARQERT